jgi:hypothetical protein
MAVNTPVITGYYRYTDIWYEWPQALPDPDDYAPLKASIAHDALVHPDHPLRKEGVDGIEMYMGTLQNGESRLLFSSAQVDYMRYWLHAMKLTDHFIPLPYSDCLLTESNLRSVSPVVFKTGGELKKSIVKISKNNKRLKGTNPMLSSRRDLFERVRNFWAEKAGVWLAMDFESWDRDHTLITEFGWSVTYWQNRAEVLEQGHLIVKEHKYFRNTFVDDHKANYNFGESEVVTKAEFKTRICDLFVRLSGHGPIYLVFHDNSQDIKYLKSKAVGAPLAGLSYILPDAVPEEGLFVVDTSDLFGALEGEGSATRRSLDRVCKHLQVPTEYLHNAGNDAHYTLLAMKSMASGDPLDIQREKRWPNRTGTAGSHGVQVQFQPWEENSDYSDQEGVSYPSYNWNTGELKRPQEQVEE